MWMIFICESCKIDLVFSNSSIIVFLVNLIFSMKYCLYPTTIICILHFSNLLYSQIIFKRCLKNCVDLFPISLQKYLVHDLNPTCNSDNPNLTIIFFHGIAFGTNDELKETWTTCPTNNRKKCICWPEMWLPEEEKANNVWMSQKRSKIQPCLSNWRVVLWHFHNQNLVFYHDLVQKLQC